MIGIIDYGMGNLGSVTNACRFLDLSARVVTRPEEAEACPALILPGVGGFGDCMRHLREHGFAELVRDWIAEDRPLLGICLGLQVLFASSEESPEEPGLSILPGTVRRFAADTGHKVPQIGWNQIEVASAGHDLFAGIPDRSFFYFVHSYYVDCAAPDVVAGRTDYGHPYTSAVVRGNLAAVQFHPEKSQELGLRLLRNFAQRAERVGS